MMKKNRVKAKEGKQGENKQSRRREKANNIRSLFSLSLKLIVNAIIIVISYIIFLHNFSADVRDIYLASVH